MNLSWLCWIDYSIMTAQKSNPVQETEPLADLTRDTLEHIEGIKKELDSASADLDALESLGIDTSRLREKIDWGYKARDVILKQFGKKE